MKSQTQLSYLDSSHSHTGAVVNLCSCHLGSCHSWHISPGQLSPRQLSSGQLSPGGSCLYTIIGAEVLNKVCSKCQRIVHISCPLRISVRKKWAYTPINWSVKSHIISGESADSGLRDTWRPPSLRTGGLLGQDRAEHGRGTSCWYSSRGFSSSYWGSNWSRWKHRCSSWACMWDNIMFLLFIRIIYASHWHLFFRHGFDWF